VLLAPDRAVVLRRRLKQLEASVGLVLREASFVRVPAMNGHGRGNGLATPANLRGGLRLNLDSPCVRQIIATVLRLERIMHRGEKIEEVDSQQA
jgi:hypothetical protein